MADNKQQGSNEAPKAGSKDDAGQAEVQARTDEAEAKGYLGTVPPGPPNEAFSLESGADSPSAAEQAEFGQFERDESRK